MLFILGGLPGSGKSTLALGLAQSRRALHLRIDTVEQAMRNAGQAVTGPEGYHVAGAIAADNLKLGFDVIADSVNPIEYTRAAWRQVAQDSGVSFLEIEITCSDPAEHRRRVENRPADIPDLTLPTWQQVLDRQYEPWQGALRIDTAGQGPQASVQCLEKAIAHALA